MSIGGVNVNASFVTAVLRARQEATLTGSHVIAGSITAKSYFNADDATAQSAQAKLYTGGGALINVRVNVAVAYARSQSDAGLNPASLNPANANAAVSIDILTRGYANVLAEVSNMGGISATSAALSAAYAYGQSGFDAFMVVPDDASREWEVEAGQVTVKADTTSLVRANLTPSIGGVDIAKYNNIKVNVAVAQNSTRINAYLSGTGAMRAGAVEVTATGVALSLIHI